MTKIRVSADELVHILHEKLVKSGKCPRGFPIAVIPDEAGSGWTAVAGALQRNRQSACVERLAALQKELQAVYVLRR
jgi:hypothetical protein